MYISSVFRALLLLSSWKIKKPLLSEKPEDLGLLCASGCLAVGVWTEKYIYRFDNQDQGKYIWQCSDRSHSSPCNSRNTELSIADRSRWEWNDIS